MTLREQIVAEALSLIGTPWHHRAMLPGIAGGIDCARALEWVAKQCGLLALDWEPPIYSSEWHLHNTVEALLGVLTALGCVPVPLYARQAGDIVTLQFGKVASHTAILVAIQPDYIVHALHDIGRVVHQRLDPALLARVRGCYTFPGVF